MKLLTPKELAGLMFDKEESLVLATWSSPKEKKKAQRVQGRLVKIAGKITLQLVFFEEKRSITKNYAWSESLELFSSLATNYSSIFFRTTKEEITFSEVKEGLFRKKTKQSAQKSKPDLEHNRKKNIAFQEGVAVDALAELGIMTKEGRVKGEARAKFTQINHFIELIKHTLVHFTPGQTISIIDMGCGKAYLTFALYHFLTTKTDFNVKMVGIDLKQEVVEKCSLLAKKLGYSGLSFLCQDVALYQPDHAVDMVIALHACNTATDVAIQSGVKWHAKAIFVAPCCQQEVLSQLKEESFPLLLKDGLFRERFASLLTDAIRAELLRCSGYDVAVLEFVDAEQTPKNIMLRATRTTGAFEISKKYEDVKDKFHLHPTLEKLLYTMREL